MMQQEITLQHLVRQHGSLNAGVAAGYVSQIADELQHLHQVRHICHLDVRPATIILTPDGKAALTASTQSQSFSEEGAATDRRDLQAVHHYLLTGLREQTEEAPAPDPTPAEKKRLPWLTALASCLIVALACVLAITWLHRKPTTETATRPYADYVWQGQWQNGKPDGNGIARYTDGRLYQGRMSKGIRNDKQARFTYADGNVFTGEFAADTIRQGRVSLSTGDYYFVGHFSAGAPFDGYWYRTSDNRKVEHVEKGKETLL